MGCCWSSQIEPENEPLLENVNEGDEADTNEPSGRLQLIVQEASERLVDISSTKILDKLQASTIHERSLEYQRRLKDKEFVEPIIPPRTSPPPLQEQIQEFETSLRKTLESDPIYKEYDAME